MEKNIPIWVQSGRALRQYPWMDGDVRADVCVIGGGVTGVLCALGLIREGRSVVLLSRRPIGHGATSRLLPCSLLDWGEDIRALARRVGRETAARLMELTAQAADELEQLCYGLPTGAGFARRDCVIYADSDTDADQLRRAFGEYRRAGLDCSMMDRAAFGSAFAFPAAGALVLREGAVELDPYMLAQRAAAEAADSGAIIFENTRAERISQQPDGSVKIYTSTHRTVSARQAVIAAGSACGELMGGITAGRTRYVTASRPVSSFRGWHGRCVVRSYSQPGIICCTSPEERVFVSCEASPAAEGRERLRDALHLSPALHRRCEELEASARYLFPEVGVRGYVSGWSYRSLRTSDGLPVVGRTQGQPGCIFAVSGGEGGVLLSMLMSRLVTDELCGRQPEDVRLFSPERRRLAG